MKQRFEVTGMTCSACSAHVDKAVKKIDGVMSADVSLLGQSMTVEYDESLSTPQDIIKAVEKAGYGASLYQAAKTESKPAGSSFESDIADYKRRFIASLVFMLPLFYISMGHMMGAPLPSFMTGIENSMVFAFTQLLLTAPIIVINLSYFTRGFRSLFHGAPNMDTLIAIGASAAVVYSVTAMYSMAASLGARDLHAAHASAMDLYFESAAMILTLITMGKFLEAKAKGRTSDALAALADLSPKTAFVLRNGVETQVPVEEVRVGDHLIVRQGSAVPVDGVVISGNAQADESALTGESMPVEKSEGDRLLCASVISSGYITMQAQSVGADTTLAKMIALVEEAGASKAPIAKLADKVSGVFVPVVIAIALVTCAAWLIGGQSISFAISSAIAVLVISCPCALGLATPVAIMVGTGRGAKNGVLFKTAEALEELSKVKTVILDKTGTLTEGKPSVTDVIPLDGMDEADFLRMAASVEKLSEHVLASAIVSEAENRGIAIEAAQGFEAVAGRGIKADISGENWQAGNADFMAESGIDIIGSGALTEKAAALADEGKTVLYFAREGRLKGMIALADVPKASSKAAVRLLKNLGLSVVMLTGDNEKTAKAIGKSLGISNIFAQVLPTDKEQAVRMLQQKGHVAMIGDGINDAPALKRADVGIAIGAGTDIAVESADVVLMKSDLMDAVLAVRFSRATLKNIKSNLFWAFFYNTACIPLAAGLLYAIAGFGMNPMLAAAAMSLSSVSVVLNSLRLNLFKSEYSESEQQRDRKRFHSSSRQEKHIDNIMVLNSKGDESMNKTVKIEGMTCKNCVAHVKKALEAMDGVQANVVLEDNAAYVTGSASDDAIRAAVTDAGYEVISIN
ncbi:MAG: heavy metal translocating P-type ATPase [Christensenellales bacterium]|jgi:Cu+-exporting ATPase